ncbi:ABC transporter transmembrane domain-containing protein [Pseudodonghicola sp. IC7]|uniref:ABC transporter transmembrane domain-containing protein n=2 Tax=Pseudodonghicola flavimaris TaxID=3050036 RepID=A0ABT7EXW1_9RHOB|nr:ABC transporter transmembrane domain-containing protein [Pseudodonghicola flavimaris]MDK3017190.1 ABC transporter transmembrane domain-containing protein [Pseudodonghicola flavimaris]
MLYLTLELPKRIINDAIGSQSKTITYWGVTFDQVPFLGLLCLGFLVAVLAHGLLKMRINTMKGVLSERMLRRFRYQLIARVLRFPQPYFERVSQGELVSMITAESEPMGGLMGDAISQPVLQAGQMITILGFLFLQSFWFGVAAVAMIPLQAWLIPKLQRQINQLNKTRIKEVRTLAAAIGESAAGASTLRVNGGWRYRMSAITEQLGRLYDIRFEIYQKKFFMKFLNNFIGQLTPFFFYSVGGLLVIQGAVSLGALVAALAAYKDLSSPWKELLTYYNQTQDMSLRWEVITERFAPAGMVEERLFDGEPESLPHLDGDIRLDGVTVRDADGNMVLEDLTATLASGTTIGIAAPSEEDRRALAELLTRELLPSGGHLRIGDLDLSGLHQAVIATRIGLASARPVMFQGSFGDNVLMPVRQRPHGEGQDAPHAAEALRAGNSPDPFDANWLDPGLAGCDSPEALRAWWLELLRGMGAAEAMFQRGLDQKFDEAEHPQLAARLVELRSKVQAAVEEAGLGAHVYLCRRDRYNAALPVGENLLFATPRRPVTAELLPAQSGFMGQLRQLGLDETLVELTRDVIDMLRRIFGIDGTDHPLFRKLGIDSQTYETALDLVEKTRDAGAAALSEQEMALFLMVPFRISAEQIGPAFSDELKARILELRASHAPELLQSLGDLFVPLSRDAFAPGFTVLENALFGKISDAAGSRGDELRKIIARVLADNGAQDLVIELIYDLPIAIGGQNLPGIYAEPLAFSRATIKKPDILILDQIFASTDAATLAPMLRNLRALLPQTTMICLADRFEDDGIFDSFFELRQGRIVSEGAGEGADQDSGASADLARKLRALEQTPLFSGLNRKQLRLLAFGARWYHAGAGEVIFLKGDQPKDGAYMVIEGEAGLYLPREGGESRLISRVGPGTLVGELGLIRKVPRALSMVAETELTCLRIGEEEFLAVVENDAATAFKLLQVVAGYVSS